jgi:hypothetical protein
MSGMATWLQLAGTVTGFVGAVFLGVSQQGISDHAAVVEVKPGGAQTVTAFVFLRHPRLWRWGFVLLSFGFVLQFFGYVIALKASGR